MTYVLALLGAIVGAAIGAFLGFTVAAILAPMLGISSFEGASGYFAVLFGGPLGGLLGLVLGAVLVLRKRGHPGFGAIAGRLGLVVLGIALIAGGVLGFLYLTQDTVNPNGSAPQLREFSAWQRADFIAEPGRQQARRATSADNYEIRYRADWAGQD
jgi:hypothetical protein